MFKKVNFTLWFCRKHQFLKLMSQKARGPHSNTCVMKAQVNILFYSGHNYYSIKRLVCLHCKPMSTNARVTMTVMVLVVICPNLHRTMSNTLITIWHYLGRIVISSWFFANFYHHRRSSTSNDIVETNFPLLCKFVANSYRRGKRMACRTCTSGALGLNTSHNVFTLPLAKIT